MPERICCLVLGVTFNSAAGPTQVIRPSVTNHAGSLKRLPVSSQGEAPKHIHLAAEPRSNEDKKALMRFSK
jgi:hypothetical protein